MNTENVLTFYQELGFEEIDIEDGLTALFTEADDEGSYALLTDDNGEIPKQLKQTVFFTCYSPQDSFQWSASFKNSFEFKDIWLQADSMRDKLEAVKSHREKNETF